MRLPPATSTPAPKKRSKLAGLYPDATALARSMKYRQRDWPREPASLETSGAIDFRAYQQPVFRDRKSGVLILHWARQIGKSFTLAAWAVDRLISRPGRLVTVLSNSRENGMEFLRKCAEICEKNRTQFRASLDTPGLDFENMRLELRITAKGKTGRIKVLAANPRTARGFSGDLILDEFAFHEDAEAIWEAAEPILSSHPDFLCRIASTGNGSHNLFYRLAEPALTATVEGGQNLDPDGVGLQRSQSGYALSRVTRSQAFRLGVKIYDTRSREEITPELARERALDKQAYDQNYECVFDHSSRALLTRELIDAAERGDVGIICEQNWSSPVGGIFPQMDGVKVSVLEFLRARAGCLYAGFDIARKVDLSVITVMEKAGEQFLVRAILRMQDLRLPEQQARLREICRLPKFQRAAIDMTGLGFALVEHLEDEFKGRIQGINFAATVPVTNAIQEEGRKREKVRVTEALAVELLRAYEERRIQHPGDARLRDDLCKPERTTTPGGRVSIAATRDEAGHADHFWSFALALEAAAGGGGKFAYEPVRPNPGRSRGI